MLDERWSEDVEEIGDALRKMLSAECTAEHVRRAEAGEGGRDPVLEAQLEAFGLDGLVAPPEMFARIAYELGRAIAPVAYVETIPILALLGRSRVGHGGAGLVPAALTETAVRRLDGLFVEPVSGDRRRTAAGDWLITQRQGQSDEGERLGDLALADRVERYAGLVEAARLVGAGQALLAYGVSYAAEREQFGRIIGTYQGVAHRLSRAAGELDAAELLVRKAAYVAAPEQGGDGAPSRAFAIMAWTKAVEAARFVAANVHQVFGGNGFAMEYDVQLYSRRLRSWAMRGPRVSLRLADLGRMVLEPATRDGLSMLWHYEQGMPLPRWAREAEANYRASNRLK